MLLEVNNLSCYYDNKVLDNINFDVVSNDILCIIGANGSGKSTLLKSLINIVDFDGEILIDKENIKNKDRLFIAKKIAFMNQMPDIYFNYNVYDTIMLGRYSSFQSKLFSMPNKDDKKIVLKYIDKLNLMHLKDKLINELSGGELQRVFLARVFSQDPDIIILDEPTNHLDISNQIELINILKEWVYSSDNKSVISVLHDINTAFSFANKLLVLKNGMQKYFGSLDSFDINILDEVYDFSINSYMKSIINIWKK